MQAIRDVEDYPLYLLADFLGGLDALERLKRHAGFAFGFVPSSFGSPFVRLRLGSRPAPDHHHQS